MSHAPTGTSSANLRADELTESDRHALLSSECRRAVLAVIDGRSTGIGLDDLAAAVTEREKSGSETASLRQLRVALHHKHLPKMAEYGVLTYDPGKQFVSL